MSKRSLTFSHDDPWPDGLVVKFYLVPFPYRRKPVINVREEAARPQRIADVPMALLNASQRGVTDTGLAKAHKVTALPRAYEEEDGRYTIADGHHRVVAAWLRGEDQVRIRIIGLPRKR